VLGDPRAGVPFIMTDQLGDYALAEPAMSETGNGTAVLDIDPKRAADALSGVAERYLELLPHESSSFAVMLYNAEAKELPKAVASKLAGKVEQDATLSCELLLTHEDPGRMRWTYEQQNLAVEDEASMVGPARESARHFLSRLRVGFLDEDEGENGAPAVNLVFLQDVVARNALITWFPAPTTANGAINDLVPTRWSRRRPVEQGDRRGTVYISAPVQPKPGQHYLNALHAMLDRGDVEVRDMLPARVVDFNNPEIGALFRRTHELGEWVVNYDELADRRLIEEAAGIRVIRHIRDRRADRNLVISTGSEGELLRTLLLRRLSRIGAVPAQEEMALADRLIARALELSEQIVMRAARHGVFANELIGTVLSMERLRRGLEAPEERVGWICLDDHAGWFGLKEQQIADVMAIVPNLDGEGRPQLNLALSEVKCVGTANAGEQANKSKKQLHATINRITRALDPERARIDRAMWLHRIDDLMLERIRPFERLEDEPLAGLEAWSEAVRRDEVPVRILGFSHIFVHDEDEPLTLPRGRSPFGRAEEACVQEVFDAPAVRAELRRFAGRSGEADAPDMDPRGAWPEALRSKREGAARPEPPHAEEEPCGVVEPLPPAEPGPRDKTPTSTVEPGEDSPPAPEPTSGGAACCRGRAPSGLGQARAGDLDPPQRGRGPWGNRGDQAVARRDGAEAAACSARL